MGIIGTKNWLSIPLVQKNLVLSSSGFARKVRLVSRQGAKTQSAAAFLKDFFAPWRLCGRTPLALAYFSGKASSSFSLFLIVAEFFSVITQAARDHVQRLCPIVNVCDLHLLRFVTRKLLVTQEVVLQTIDQPLRHVVNFEHAAVSEIVFEHGDDLVVSLAAVDHPQPANRSRA